MKRAGVGLHLMVGRVRIEDSIRALEEGGQ